MNNLTPSALAYYISMKTRSKVVFSEEPDFLAWFLQCTPINWISRTR